MEHHDAGEVHRIQKAAAERQRCTAKEKIMSSYDTTTDHETIQKWVEERDRRPCVIRTEGKGGVLRIDFGEKEEAFEEVDWDEFFKIFDYSELAFLYQDKTKDGETSRFNKFVERGGQAS